MSVRALRVWAVATILGCLLALAPAGAASAATIDDGVLRVRLDAYLRTRSDVAEVTVYDRRTGVTVTSAPKGLPKIRAMSTIKVPILLTLLRQAATRHRAPTASERSLAWAMITRSDNAAATTLWNRVGGASAVLGLVRRLGATPYLPASPGMWGTCGFTSRDEALVVRAVAYGHPALAGADLAYARSLMRSVIAYQRWGVSAGPTDVRGTVVQLKNGWSTGGYRVHSVGHVYGAGRDYVIAVMTYRNPSMSYGVATVQGASRIVWSALAARDGRLNQRTR
ncbi:MAG: serine hydrolase [Motilibacteraceae bacterium]